MKKYNITTKRTFEGKNGEKTIWNNVGTMRVTDDKKIYIELFMFPNTPFFVFPIKEEVVKEPEVETNQDEEIPF